MGRPTQAKQYGDHWQITYSQSGSVTGTGTRTNGQTFSPSYTPRAATQTGISDHYNPGNGYVASLNLTYNNVITTTLIWVSPSHNPAPAKVNLIVNSSVQWESNCTGASGDAADGLNDPCVPSVPNGISASGTSSGKHIVHKNSSSGTVTLTYQQTGSAQASASSNCGAGFSWSFSVGFDPRSLNVASSVDATFHKQSNANGTYSRVQNTADADEPSIMYGDTGLPPSSTTITYNGVTDTSLWAFSSFQAWLSSVGSPSSYSTTWNDFVHNLQFATTYNPQGATPAPQAGSTDIVQLTATDAQDGAIAKASYYMRLHNPFETWIRSTNIHHPLPSSPTPDNQGEWTLGTTISNNSDVPQTGSCIVQAGTTATVQGTIGTEGSFQFSGQVISIGFKQNENITIGQQYTLTTSQTLPVNGAPHMKTYFYWGIGWQHRTGTADYYDANGFNGNYGWQADIPDVMPSGNPGISTAYWTEPL